MDTVSSQLDALARMFRFCRTGESEAGIQYSYPGGPFPFWIVARFHENDQLSLYGRVRIYNLAGCRTDLHDWVGGIWAACLRFFGVASAWVIDELGFLNDDEISGRFLVFEQPGRGAFSLKSDKGEILRLFGGTAFAAEAITKIWRSSEVTENDEFDYDTKLLSPAMVGAFSRKVANPRDIYGTRSGSIGYWRRCRNDISFTDFSKCPAWPKIWELFASPMEGAAGESVGAHLVRSGKIRNAFPKREMRTVTRLHRIITSNRNGPIRFVPCDSHLFAITPTGLYSKRVNCGADSYAREFEELRRQHFGNAAFLNQDLQFEWLESCPPSRFEMFVRELLSRHPDVRRVTKRGHCNEPDAGADLIAEVLPSFVKKMDSKTEGNPDQTFRIIVQCKVSKNNVGKSSVRDVHDTVDRHGGVGFLLVVVPGITSTLMDYMESVRARGQFWIECWARPQLEALLRTDPSVAPSYGDIVKVIPPREGK
jgi:hypothetical protein